MERPLLELRSTPRWWTASVACLLLLICEPGWGQSLFGLSLSPADEKRIGAEQHAQILAEFGGAYEDSELAAYVDSIGQFLAQTSRAPGVGYTFTILDSPVINAFALPGGYVYVTRGLMSLCDSEAELAGVLAHEIGHVVARHGAKRHGQGVLATIGLAVLGAVTKSPGVMDFAQLGALAFLRGNSREDEFEADRLGVGYMTRAGFSPQAMSSFLAKMQAHSELESLLHGKRPGEVFDFFATHPRTTDRVARAIDAAGSGRVSEPIVARDIYLAKIDGMLYGDDPEQGLVQGRRFVHPTIGFEFTVPESFSILNGESSVAAQGPESAGIRFDFDRPHHRGSMVDYIKGDWVADAQTGRITRLQVGALPAATARLRLDREGSRIDIRLVAIAFDADRIARFMFITPAEVTARYDAAFLGAARSFRRLSSEEADDIRPRRIAIHEVADGQTLADVAALSAFENHPVTRLRVLNGLPPGARLAPAQRIKIVKNTNL